MTQIRIPKRALRYGARTRARRVYTSGGTFTGSRTRSRYGYTHGSVFRVRTRDAAKYVYPAQITAISRTGSARIERHYASTSNGPELKPSTRAPYTVRNTSQFRKPNRTHPNYGFRTRNARVTRRYTGREYPKYLRKYPRRPGRTNNGPIARGMRFENGRFAHLEHRIYYRFPNSRRFPGIMAESQYPPFRKQIWMHRYAHGHSTSQHV